MSAATDIRERYADIIASAERQARADAGMICSICTGDHRTNDCELGHLWIAQCENSTVSPPPDDFHNELVKLIRLIQSVVGSPTVPATAQGSS